MSVKLPLTMIDPKLERLVRATPRGAMAHWAGTGPAATTCGQCQRYGYYASIKSAAGDTIGSVHKHQRCELYWILTHKHGAVLKASTASCKHFTRREEEDAK
jgi:hypothetical protein